MVLSILFLPVSHSSSSFDSYPSYPPQPPTTSSPSSSLNHVLVIGATSRLQAVDPSLRRAGRFDREISLGIPDEKSRSAILDILCARTALAPELSLRQLARETPGYCGADLMALCREAAMVAVDRILKTNLMPEGSAAWESDVKEIPTSKDNLFRWLLHQPPIRCFDIGSFACAGRSSSAV